MKVLGSILGVVMHGCYQLVQNYGLAILLFTLVTKFVLLPLNIWLHKNGIKIVKMQADINNIKADYYGDASMIAEKQSALYKKEKYNPLVSLIPLAIQIVLLMGLVEVIYHPFTYILRLSPDVIETLQTIAASTLGLDTANNSIQLSIVNAIQNGTLLPALEGVEQLADAVSQISSLQVVFVGINICLIPSVVMGWMVLMPLAAAFSSWLLCVFQNSQQVLQSEQGKVNKYGTMLLSVALSLYLGWFVPAGVAIYWVFSNLFSIVQTSILNRIINPRKFVDYEALEKSRQRLNEIEALQPDKHSSEAKRNAQREKQDYKRFFSVGNKHIVFYSEKSGFYKYFRGVIEYLVQNSNLVIHYVTNDPNDQIFEIAKKQPQIHPYYIGLKKTITLMMRMDADIVVMTTPDIENYFIKRSYVRKDIEYIYLFHGLTSTTMVVRKGAYDHFDTIFCAGEHHVEELRECESMYQLPAKNLVRFGYGLLDDMIEGYEKQEHHGNAKPRILIAPSWQDGNLLDICIDDMLGSLMNRGYDVCVRPHPEYIKRFGPRMNALMKRYEREAQEGLVTFETDFSANDSVFNADVLITDWSGIAYEFAYVTFKPTLFIDTPMKVLNEDYVRYSSKPLDITMRNEAGISIKPEEASQSAEKVAYMLEHKDDFVTRIQALRDKYVFNIGKSSEVGGRYILNSLIEKRNKAKG